MANYYRKYLKEKNVLPSEPEDVDFLVEVVGNITARDTIIGLIPIKAVVPITTFEQCQEIVDYLKNNEVNNFALKLSGFNKHGLFGQTPGNMFLRISWEAKDKGSILEENGVRRYSLIS